MTSSDEILTNLRKLLNMEIVAETSWTLNSDEIYALRDLFAEVERLKSQLAYIEGFMVDQRLSVDETYAQIFRFLKGGER